MIGVGIDIGGTFVKILVMHENGRIISQEKVETNYSKGADFFIKQLGQYVKNVQTRYPDQKVAVGIGAPGDVDDKKGILRYNPNLKFNDIDNWPIGTLFYQQTGITPCVANDATLAAWGVYEVDLKRQGENVLVITLGTGVGGGMIIHKELYQGSHGSAGEIGHTKIADIRTGPLCGCGARGCVEAFVGTIGIKRRVMEAVALNPNSILAAMVEQEQNFKIELVSRAAEKGCKAAKKVWDDTGFYLGVAIANFGLILDMDTVVLAGGVSGAFQYFEKSMWDVLNNQQIKTPFTDLKIMTSKTPNIGGVGAAMYAVHQALKELE